MQLAVVAYDDGTFGLNVDGEAYIEQDEVTLFSRGSVDQVVADARSIFGGYADTIAKPGDEVEPEPQPVDENGDLILPPSDPSTETPGPAPPTGSVG